MERNNWLSHAEWVVMFLTILGSIYAMRSDINDCNCRFDQFMLAWRQESNDRSAQWHEEMKDFHGRLCAIEERNKK